MRVGYDSQPPVVPRESDEAALDEDPDDDASTAVPSFATFAKRLDQHPPTAPVPAEVHVSPTMTCVEGAASVPFNNGGF